MTHPASENTAWQLHLPVSQPISALDLLQQHCKLSKAQLKKAIAQGCLWREQGHNINRFRQFNKILATGEQLHFYYDEQILAQQCDPAQLIHQAQHYSIWYKPYGMLCQGSKWSDHLTIQRFVEQQLQRPCFIVHRLDRAAQGLILIAHSKAMARYFSQCFEHKTITKTYHILVHGNFSTLVSPTIVDTAVAQKPAKTAFSLINYNESLNISKLNVDLFTGRKHQIRLHAASIGFPVVGDRLHGAAINYPESLNLQLCAVQLAFDCPEQQQKITIKLPEQLQPDIEAIAKYLS